MSKQYLLIRNDSVHIPSQGHGYEAYTKTIDVNKFFNTQKELLDWLDIWGKDIKDPFIFEVERVKLETKTTVALVK